MKTDIPHHDGSSLYVSDQAPTVGSQIRLRMRIPATYGSVDRVFVRSVRDGEPHFDEAHRTDAPDCPAGPDHSWQWWECVVLAVNPVLRYRFLIETNHQGRPAWEWLNAEGLFDRETPDFQDFRLITHAPAPGWVRHAVIYQVFPDRFARSSAAATRHTPEWAVPCTWDEPVQPAGEATPRQLYGGDLDGVTEHLDHIQALGATVIYLTPFFPARSNHRYDATTFTKVDPLLGGDEALIRLVDAAHHRGLRVIGDLTANHSGDAHEWFTAALEDRHSAEAGFYYFKEDHTTYASWFGVPSLPKFNWNSPELRRRFITGTSSVIGRWLAPPYNLDGWRIDVANMTGRHGTEDMNREIATMVRHTMQSIKPDSMLLAESTNDAAADFDGTTWHGAMTYSNFTRPLWQWLTKEEAPVNFFGTPIPGPNRISAKHFVQTHQALAAAFPWRIRTQNMNALNSHDTARAATVMIPGGQLVGLAMIFTLPGIPTLFAGDEFGLEGINGEEARTPMPWAEPGKIRANLGPGIGELSRLRRELPALHEGNLRWLYAGDDVLIYVREHKDVSVLVAASRAAFEAVELPASLIRACAESAALFPLWGCGTLTARSTPQSTTFSGSGPSLQLWKLPGIKVPAIRSRPLMASAIQNDDRIGAPTSDLPWADTKTQTTGKEGNTVSTTATMADSSESERMADPNWWRQAAVYQIYPRSFSDSNGDGIGDIKGITAKVPYLKSLGIDAVWLSPFYPSALADGGYDVDDYRNVDPKLGTLEDFDEMVAGLHAAGIKLIADIVPNHSSDQHEWFREALASPKGSAARDRYIFRDGKGENGELAPSDWDSVFGGPVWERITEPDGTPGQWYMHIFAKEQPDFNWDNQEVREDFLKTLRFWSDRGVDGFRIDVAHGMAKDLSEPLPLKADLEAKAGADGFIDGSHPFWDRDEVHEVYAEWRKLFNDYNPPRTAVAEAWVHETRRARYASPEGLGQAFNFDLLQADFEAPKFKKIIMDNLIAAKETGASSTWVFSNHDVVRHATRYGLPKGNATAAQGTNAAQDVTATEPKGQDGKAWLLAGGPVEELDVDLGLRRARAASLLMFALPGSAYLYQGEELGLQEVAEIPESERQDPAFFRNKGVEVGRDGCRVPLPWSVAGSSFGFGHGRAHLPQPDWFSKYAVEAQDGTEGSTLELYRTALNLRRELQAGEELEWVETSNPEILHFRRPGGWQSVTNFGDTAIDLPAGTVLVSSAILEDGKLPANTTAWLR